MSNHNNRNYGGNNQGQQKHMHNTNGTAANHNVQSQTSQPDDVTNPQDNVPEVLSNTTPPVNPPNAHEITKVIGVVMTDRGKKLNLRKEANSNADIITTIDRLCEVSIDKENSTDDFYSVVTASGVEGYVMKSFIKIKE